MREVIRGNAPAVMPVSYTHLDVYKRQGFGCLCAAPGHVTSFTVYQRLLGLAARRPAATTPSQSSALPRSTSTPRSTTACTRRCV